MRKKILFAIPQSSAFTIPITQALISMGFDVYHFDYLKPNALSRSISVLVNKLHSSKFSSLYINIVNSQLLSVIKQIRPMYLFVIKGETLKSETLAKIKAEGIITINWFPDNIGLWNVLIKTAKDYQFYISVCEILTKELNKFGRPTLYLPVADVADQMREQIDKEYNLVFAGHKTLKRIDYLSHIADLGFNLWGYPHWKESSIASYYHDLLSVKDMKSIFRRSKIVVNVSTGEEGVPISIANLKNFEATGVGAFVLSEYSPALSKLFKEDKEMVFFKSKKELRQKAVYYLEHDKKRECIAEAGWIKTKKEHTYIHRMKKMFNYINNLYI